MSVQRCRRWPSIILALGQCILSSGVSGAGKLKGHQQNAALRKHGTITQYYFNERRRLWVNIETALVECHVLARSIQTCLYISVGPAPETIDRH